MIQICKGITISAWDCHRCGWNIVSEHVTLHLVEHFLADVSRLVQCSILIDANYNLIMN